MQFQRLIMADWSAANSPGPLRPRKDRCWVGRLDAGEIEPTLAYCRTRADALAQIEVWTAEVKGSSKTLIGFDFPFGYPEGCGLPGGRALCQLLGEKITDDDRDRNNRFQVAGALNQSLNPGGEGPFWGRPASRPVSGVQTTKPKPWPAHIPEFRIVELGLKRIGIQSVWKLAYPAAVGSQVLMGMSAIGRLLDHPTFAPAKLWPFETDWADDLGLITIAEIWPNLFFPDLRNEPRVAQYAIRDAGQIAATLLGLQSADRDGRIAAMLAPQQALSDEQRQAAIACEGWIVGV